MSNLQRQELEQQIVGLVSRPEYMEPIADTVESVLKVYGYKNERSVDFDPKSPTPESEKQLREGLAEILTGFIKTADVIDQNPPEKRTRTHSSSVLDIDEIKNAKDELLGERAGSARLIHIMPVISDMAREVEKAGYYMTYGEPTDKPLINKFIYSYDLNVMPVERRVKQEERISEIEKYVKDNALKWEENSRTKRVTQPQKTT